jgi:DnaD/phage-associated family protein|tara:strand:+ start:162 stop:884 length:723 start_codon:yes stop_codon:yes gene_type:complete
MTHFNGFPAKMQFTPVPNLFFSQLLPQIDDINELKTTLRILWTLYSKRCYPRFVTHTELLDDTSLMSTIKEAAKPADKALRNAIRMATLRGTILHLIVDINGKPEDLYFLNTQSDKQAVAKIQNGELKLPGLKAKMPPSIKAEQLPDIFALYEQNIGMLTPMIAEELREAEKLYPETWIRDAIKEAVNQNKRKWSYISAILENWSTKGRRDGAYRRDTEKEDPDKYIKGKYGHMVRRFGR